MPVGSCGYVANCPDHQVYIACTAMRNAFMSKREPIAIEVQFLPSQIALEPGSGTTAPASSQHMISANELAWAAANAATFAAHSSLPVQLPPGLLAPAEGGRPPGHAFQPLLGRLPAESTHCWPHASWSLQGSEATETQQPGVILVLKGTSSSGPS